MSGGWRSRRAWGEEWRRDDGVRVRPTGDGWEINRQGDPSGWEPLHNDGRPVRRQVEHIDEVLVAADRMRGREERSETFGPWLTTSPYPVRLVEETEIREVPLTYREVCAEYANALLGLPLAVAEEERQRARVARAWARDPVPMTEPIDFPPKDPPMLPPMPDPPLRRGRDGGFYVGRRRVPRQEVWAAVLTVKGAISYLGDWAQSYRTMADGFEAKFKREDAARAEAHARANPPEDALIALVRRPDGREERWIVADWTGPGIRIGPWTLQRGGPDSFLVTEAENQINTRCGPWTCTNLGDLLASKEARGGFRCTMGRRYVKCEYEFYLLEPLFILGCPSVFREPTTPARAAAPE